VVLEGFMTTSFNLSRAASFEVLNRLRALRASIAQARNALVHFQQDRLDRDKLEPAARQVDLLINMFAGELRDPARGFLLMTEIQKGVDQVTNPNRPRLCATRELISPRCSMRCASLKLSIAPSRTARQSLPYERAYFSKAWSGAHNAPTVGWNQSSDTLTVSSSAEVSLCLEVRRIRSNRYDPTLPNADDRVRPSMGASVLSRFQYRG
jgi:hypothetical protein